jgi:hypothetical protein
MGWTTRLSSISVDAKTFEDFVMRHGLSIAQ